MYYLEQALAFILHPLHAIILIVLLGAIGYFLRYFWGPSSTVDKELSTALASLAALKKQGEISDLSRVQAAVEFSPTLNHCWQEYRDTLHGQKGSEPDALGQLPVKAWRAGALAGTFFTEQVLIDTRLRTEFFKHLPGILTGVGIIGTFLGLIVGLKGFQVTENAKLAQDSLGILIRSVGDAFVLSGLAIFTAMVITAVEKARLNRLYAKVEELCGLIDGLFKAGVGEEYLEKLVDAAQTSATQATQMKETLVTDLKAVLSELATQQIDAMAANNTALATRISDSLSEGLKEPLTRISDAVQTVGGNQGEAVNKLLTDVLSSFSERMEQMFGSQMRGMNEVLHQTAQTIQATASRFDSLAQKVEQAGSGAAEAMARRMEELMNTMSARQGEANAQMAAFIDGIKQSIARGQGDTAAAMESMLARLDDSMTALVRRLQQQAEADAASSAARQAEAAEQMHRSMQELAESMRAMVEQLQKAVGDSASEAQATQKELADQMRHSMQDMGEGMRALVLEMQAAAAQTAGDSRAGQQALSEQMGRMVQTLADDMKALVLQLQAQAAAQASDTKAGQQELAESVKALIQQLQSSIDEAGQGQRAGQEMLAQQMRNTVDGLGQDMKGLVHQLQAAARSDVERSGEERERTAQAIQALLSDLAQRMGELVGNLKEQIAAAGRQNHDGQAELARLYTTWADTQRAQTERLTEAVARASQAMRDAIDRLVTGSGDSIERMKAGAERLHGASEHLSERLGDMRAVTSGLDATALKLSNAGGQLNLAAEATQLALADHRQVRDTLAAMVADLRATVDSAKREAGLTRELVEGLGVASQRLVDAQRDAEGYLEGISDVLVNAHNSFKEQVTNTLRHNNADFHKELAQAVNILKDGIENLGDALDKIPSMT